MYSKTCFKQPFKKKTKIGFQDRLSFNAGQKYSWSILQYFRASLSKTFILFIFSGRLTQVLMWMPPYYLNPVLPNFNLNEQVVLNIWVRNMYQDFIVYHCSVWHEVPETVWFHTQRHKARKYYEVYRRRWQVRP